MKKQLDEEVQHLTNSYQNLKGAQSKFKECVGNVRNGVAESAKGKRFPTTTAPRVYPD